MNCLLGYTTPSPITEFPRKPCRSWILEILVQDRKKPAILFKNRENLESALESNTMLHNVEIDIFKILYDPKRLVNILTVEI